MHPGSRAAGAYTLGTAGARLGDRVLDRGLSVGRRATAVAAPGVLVVLAVLTALLLVGVPAPIVLRYAAYWFGFVALPGIAVVAVAPVGTTSRPAARGAGPSPTARWPRWPAPSLGTGR